MSAKTFWERRARVYDAAVALLGHPSPRLLQLAVESARGAGNVLEVAAGTGLLTAALAPAAGRVVATDYAEAMVGVLRRRVAEAGLANVVCERADLYDLPYESGAFDVVVAANVLHLVPDVPGALSALRRVLRPGGKLVAPTFCHDETLRSAAASRALALVGFPGRRRFTTSTLRATLEREGLVVERRETLPGLIPVGYVEGAFAR
ncbi:MAG TPA: class I SAM-dependent methyltransferase [Polyangiaceae bacterium]|nr:class I SAM-dependent methyltransferase [Polyangiaceae bacterium]